jgi:hypothetical protein
MTRFRFLALTTTAAAVAPRGPTFDTLPTDAPPWLASRTPLTPAEIATIDGHAH